MRKLSFLCFFVLILYAGKAKADPTGLSPQDFFGSYVIYEYAPHIESYYENSRQIASQCLSKKIVINNALFSFCGDTVSQPTYQLNYQKPVPEGEVLVQSWRFIYEITPEKDDLEVLTVLRADTKKNDSWYEYVNIEIIDSSHINHLWNGWVYKMKRISTQTK